jgi:tRNA threonylcarbamoyladenosine biosynthesis protein TsaE
MKPARLLWRSAGEEETMRFGAVLGRSLAPPAWIGVEGPLGAGKTRLIQGVAAGLGVTVHVKSPTFVLEHRYRGRGETVGEDLEASWEEAGESVVLVEWAERVPVRPQRAVRVGIVPDGEAGRWIALEWDLGRSPIRDLPLGGLRRTCS